MNRSDIVGLDITYYLSNFQINCDGSSVVKIPSSYKVTFSSFNVVMHIYLLIILNLLDKSLPKIRQSRLFTW